jgi:hypothetical protein
MVYIHTLFKFRIPVSSKLLIITEFNVGVSHSSQVCLTAVYSSKTSYYA